MRILLLVLTGSAALYAQWPRYGGPRGNFSVEGVSLPAAWPGRGPKQLWKRALGEGYSAVAVDGGTLYTMFRRGQQEVVTALDSASGKTKWEHAYDAPSSGMALENGPGPHTTPLIMGDRIFTIGILARMYAFDKNTGKPVWTKDLYKDFPGSSNFNRGYSPSPIGYKNTIIVKLGGSNHAIVALSPKDGSLVWQKHTFENAPATPIVAEVNGQEQLITQFTEQVVGLNPSNGDLLWQHPHKTDYGLNITPPIVGPDSIVVVTSAYSGGARGVQIKGNKPAELWKHNRMRVHFTSAILIGDHVYGSSGDFGPSPITAVDVRTGKVAWQDRTFAKANLVRAGDKVVLLDEDGNLGLVTLSPQGMKVLARAQVATNNAWTAPSLAGSTLYVRDRRDIMAFDLD
jgi:outer membrane protein assembly factor BamB